MTIIFRTRLLVSLLVLLADSALADTTWVSNPVISGNWTADHSPYMIQTDVRVPGDSTLTIGPGVTVFFVGRYSLSVDDSGALNALGTEEDSIRFTTDTLSNPEKWRGIYLYHAADTSRLYYCIIEFAAHIDPSFGCALLITGGALQLSHSTVRRCNGSMGTVTTTAATELTACRFESNTAQYGGGLEVIQGKTRIADCVFEHNTATDGGGALDWYAFDSLFISNSVFRDNQAGNYGGGALMIETGFAEITGCTFTGNSATNGGAVRAFTYATLHMADDTLSANHAENAGGALRSDNGVLLIERGVFQHNTAPAGGALFLQASRPSVEIRNSVFIRNVATSNGGGLYQVNGGAYTAVRNCTFVSNSAAHGGGVYGVGSTPLLSNTLIAFNQGEGGYCTAVAGYHIHHSLLFGNSLGAFYSLQPMDTLGRINRVNTNGDSCDYFYNLYLDPLFADTAAGDYGLAAASPCIDAGDPASPRDPDSTVADIGAFYFPHSPNNANSTFIRRPSSFLLSSYPNPFNPATRLSLELPHFGLVTLKIFDLMGREVATLVDKRMDAGSYAITWNASAYPSGMYFAVLKTSTQQRTQKLLLLK